MIVPAGGEAVPQPQNIIQPQPPQQQAAVNAERPDFLAFIYKSIRFVFLMMVLYLYSSFERFIGVALIIAFVYFVQQRRQNRVVEQQQVQAAAENNNEEREGSEAPPLPNRTRNFNAWNVFCSTVTSFFESMIPENPQVPVNIN